MTGFGRAQADAEGNIITVEINAVNSRFLDYQIRLPRAIAALEQETKNLLSGFFHRGKILINISMEGGEIVDSIVLDEERARAYLKIYELLKKEYGFKDELSFRDFVALPELVKASKEESDLETTWKHLKAALTEAAEGVAAMRKAEGQNLAADMHKRTKSVRTIIGDIEKLAPRQVDAYREKLSSRVKELLEDSPVDDQRIAMEVTLFSDKSDITEECIRLRSHLDQFEESLDEEGPIGRRLNFILQELNREANTIGSKAADYEISRRVIIVKEEIERLREQIQNIE